MKTFAQYLNENLREHKEDSPPKAEMLRTDDGSTKPTQTGPLRLQGLATLKPRMVKPDASK